MLSVIVHSLVASSWKVYAYVMKAGLFYMVSEENVESCHQFHPIPA
jgi:hypothetical protein